jgi:hypothetical protein
LVVVKDLRKGDGRKGGGIEIYGKGVRMPTEYAVEINK